MINQINNEKINKIIIISLSGIGNNIMFTPTLIQLKKIIPNSEIHYLVVTKAIKKIFYNFPIIDKVILLSNNQHVSFKKKVNILFKAYELRKNKYDLSITIFPSNRIEYNLLSYLIGAKFRVSHSYKIGKIKTLSFLQNIKVETNDKIHDVEQNFNLLKVIKKTYNYNYKPIIYLNEKDKIFGLKFVKKFNRPIVGIHLNFVRNSTGHFVFKDIKKTFYKIFQYLKKKYNATIILMGATNEYKINKKLFEDLNLNIIYCFNKTILQIAAIITNCDLFINIESGLGHIASAVKTKSITLMGPTIKSRTSTYGNCAINLYEPNTTIYKYPFHTTNYKDIDKKNNKPIKLNFTKMIQSIDKQLND